MNEENRIRRLILEIHPGITAEEEGALIASGVLDSLEFEELFFLIEEEFGIRLEPADLTLENCQSLVHLGGLVRKYLA